MSPCEVLWSRMQTGELPMEPQLYSSLNCEVGPWTPSPGEIISIPSFQSFILPPSAAAEFFLVDKGEWFVFPYEFTDAVESDASTLIADFRSVHTGQKRYRALTDATAMRFRWLTPPLAPKAKQANALPKPSIIPKRPWEDDGKAVSEAKTEPAAQDARFTMTGLIVGLTLVTVLLCLSVYSWLRYRRPSVQTSPRTIEQYETTRPLVDASSSHSMAYQRSAGPLMGMGLARP